MDQTIIKYIKEELNNDRGDFELLPEDDLLGSGLVESISMLQLIQFIEETFEMKIPPQDMTIENFMTVQAMVNFIEKSKSGV